MAIFYSNEYQDAFIDVPSNKIAPGKQNAPILVASAQVDLAAAFTTSDSAPMIRLPKGAILHEVILQSTDLGTTGTLNVGWDAGVNGLETADADGIFAALNVNSAAVLSRPTALTWFQKEFADEVNIVIVPAASGDATSGTIKLSILYSVA